MGVAQWRNVFLACHKQTYIYKPVCSGWAYWLSSRVLFRDFNVSGLFSYLAEFPPSSVTRHGNLYRISRTLDRVAC